jgi:hypothetical protein
MVLRCNSASVVKVRNLGLYYMVNAAQIYGAIRQVLSSEEIDVVLHANILPSLVAVKLTSSRCEIPC